MPQREPLSAPLLGSLFVVAAMFAAWMVLAFEALAQVGTARLVGFGAAHLAFAPPFALPDLVLGTGPGDGHGPWPWAAVFLSGPLAALLLGTSAHLAVESLQPAAWLRALGFEAFVFACLRPPLLLLSAGLHGGRGPLSLLYGHLGEPESGRWAAIALGLIVLWGMAALVAWRAVALGRDWLRVDGRHFRRRAVRLLAGYPFVIASAAFAVERPTAPLVWLAVLLLVVLGSLYIRTI